MYRLEMVKAIYTFQSKLKEIQETRGDEGPCFSCDGTDGRTLKRIMNNGTGRLKRCMHLQIRFLSFTYKQ